MNTYLVFATATQLLRSGTDHGAPVDYDTVSGVIEVIKAETVTYLWAVKNTPAWELSAKEAGLKLVKFDPNTAISLGDGKFALPPNIQQQLFTTEMKSEYDDLMHKLKVS